jgi:NAD(P)-dependent dehydrogenase (short-subunit alcohol dehydrogenase family)
MSDEDWDATLNINLRGTFLCSRAAAREMIKQKQGKIIDVSSIYGTTRAIRNAGDYCASKAGVIQLAKVMALELAKYNIQVNVICPGYFLTPMNYEFLSSEVGQKVVKASIPMQRSGNVDELKGIAIYLASPASSFTTGAIIVVDGGHII